MSKERPSNLEEARRHWGLTHHAGLHLLDLLARHRSLVVTSGRRSPERNRAVGGVARSFHLSGRAVDLAGSRVALAAAGRDAWSRRVSAGCTGPEEVVDEGDHLHVAW